jgi:hypothetical protein
VKRRLIATLAICEQIRAVKHGCWNHAVFCAGPPSVDFEKSTRSFDQWVEIHNKTAS